MILDPQKVADHIKANPGLIQKSTYPNPGEPDVNEAQFLDVTKWKYLCLENGDQEQRCDCCDDEWDGTPALTFGYDSGSILLNQNGDMLFDSLDVWVEDGEITFEAD